MEELEPLNKSSDEPEPEAQTGSRVYRSCKLLCICLAMGAMGLANGIVGPSLPELASLLRVSHGTMMTAILFENFGLLVGSITCGFLCQRFDSFIDLLLTLCILIIGIVNCLIPVAGSLFLFSLMSLMGGIGKGGLNLGLQHSTMELFGTSAIYAQQFSFGFGFLIGPQLIEPFLSSPCVAPSKLLQASTSNVTVCDRTALWVGYTVASMPCLLCAVLFFVFHLKRPDSQQLRRPEEPLSLRSFSVTSYGKGNFRRGLVYIVLANMCIFIALGQEMMYHTFIYTYAITKKSPLSSAAAIDLNTVFNALFPMGRAVFAVVNSFVPLDHVLLTCGVLSLASSVALVIWESSHAWVLWVMTGISSFCISCYYPGIMTWAKYNLKSNALLVMILITSATVGDYLLRFLTGRLLDSIGPQVFLYVNLASAGVILLTLILMAISTTLFSDAAPRACD